MTYCTSIHCMDGRIQEPLIQYLKHKHDVDYVDTITAPGPCRILAENTDYLTVNSILDRVRVSINKHGSKFIAISGHYDCAGNPCDEHAQKNQIEESIERLKLHFPKIQITGLWIDDQWQIHEL